MLWSISANNFILQEHPLLLWGMLEIPQKNGVKKFKQFLMKFSAVFQQNELKEFISKIREFGLI